MNGKSNDVLGVTEIIVHKEEGIQRYGWKEQDGVWVKTTD